MGCIFGVLAPLWQKSSSYERNESATFATEEFLVLHEAHEEGAKLLEVKKNFFVVFCRLQDLPWQVST